ncbi:MAG TPA: prephenate/arogenate dehydrogenase family protein [Alphaproteobacteria bacterium]
MAGRPLFRRIAIVGIGLIGSSLARVVKREHLAGEIVGCDSSAEVGLRAIALGLVDRMAEGPADAAKGADLIVLCTPLSAYVPVVEAMMPALEPDQIVTEVGSCKQVVLDRLGPLMPAGVHLVPGHPVAGTEHSGPDAGFADLFEGRWCILTPGPDADAKAVERVERLWRRAGMTVEYMDAKHHDLVLAITSHLPHLIAYTIVGTATDLEEHLQSEVIKFSAGGFRDFTRIAASDPIMWRDVFLANREAVLEVLGRFSEDLAGLQRAIRRGEGKTLEDLFARTRAIRRGVIAAKQA